MDELKMDGCGMGAGGWMEDGSKWMNGEYGGMEGKWRMSGSMARWNVCETG